MDPTNRLIARVSHRAQPAITTADAQGSAYVSCSCSLQVCTNRRLADYAALGKAYVSRRLDPVIVSEDQAIVEPNRTTYCCLCPSVACIRPGCRSPSPYLSCMLRKTAQADSSTLKLLYRSHTRTPHYSAIISTVCEPLCDAVECSGCPVSPSAPPSQSLWIHTYSSAHKHGHARAMKAGAHIIHLMQYRSS